MLFKKLGGCIFVVWCFVVFFQIWGGGVKSKDDEVTILEWELGVYPNPMLP